MSAFHHSRPFANGIANPGSGLAAIAHLRTLERAGTLRDMRSGEAEIIDSNPLFWSIALLGVIVFCVAQAVRDFRARRYAWAIAAALSALVVMTVPIKTHAVKIDLPA